MKTKKQILLRRLKISKKMETEDGGIFECLKSEIKSLNWVLSNKKILKRENGTGGLI